MKKIVFFLVAAVMFFSGCGAPGTAGPGGKSGGSEKENICKYFPKELIEEAIGKPIVKIEEDSIAVDHICKYYTAWIEDFNHSPYSGDSPGGPHIVVVLENENYAAYKTEWEGKGYTFKKDESYSWENYLVTSRGSKTPYRADLLVDENNFYRITSNHFAVTDEEIVKIGKRFSERMKNGK